MYFCALTWIEKSIYLSSHDQRRAVCHSFTDVSMDSVRKSFVNNSPFGYFWKFYEYLSYATINRPIAETPNFSILSSFYSQIVKVMDLTIRNVFNPLLILQLFKSCINRLERLSSLQAATVIE